MRNTDKSSHRAKSVRRPRERSVKLEYLESRLAPGDAMLAGLLSWSFLPPVELLVEPALLGTAGGSSAEHETDRSSHQEMRSTEADTPKTAEPEAPDAAFGTQLSTTELWSALAGFPNSGRETVTHRPSIADQETAPYGGSSTITPTAAVWLDDGTPAPGFAVGIAAREEEGTALLSAAGLGVSGGVSGTDTGCDGFAYDDFSSVEGLALNGDTTQLGDRLRLTPALRNQAGSAWFAATRFVEAGFDTTFAFQITNRSNPSADGITFVIHNDAAGTSALGGVGGLLGYAEGGDSPGIANSLAVEFDMFRNPALGDPNANHISVHANGTLPNNADEAYSLGRATTLPNMRDGAVHVARVRYTPGTLDVFLDDLETSRLSVAVDLPTTLSMDDGHAWVGFTSSTGTSWERHDLLNWSFAACSVCSEAYYPDFRFGDGLGLNGDVTQVDDRLRLTSNVRGQVGSAWLAARPRIQDGFLTYFQFQLTPRGSNGDGLAFVIQNAGVSALGQAGDGLGYAGIPNSLAVEFDTFGNAETRDPNGNHVSVQTRGLLPNSAHHDYSLGAATNIPELADGAVHTVMLYYAPGILLVYLDDLETPRLEIGVNLADLLGLTHGRAWVGFTAATGLSTENHDVLNWYFTSCL